MSFGFALLLADSASDPCGDLGGGEWRDCLVDYNARLELELQQVWKKAVQSADKIDKEGVRLGRYNKASGQGAKLRNAQISWNRFRAQQCAAESDRTLGGTGGIGIELTCITQLTQQRISDLKAFVKDNDVF
jgi:uncharacterized protein YecT (DUF1311 family)